MKSVSFSLNITILFLLTVINGIIYATPTPTPTISPTPTPLECGIASRVTDAITGAGINGATVTLDTGESATTSSIGGQDGVYVLQGLSVGQHEITASAEGYLSVLEM